MEPTAVLEQQFVELKGKLAEHLEKAAKDRGSYEQITSAQAQTITMLQKQLDAIDAKLAQHNTGGKEEKKSPLMTQMWDENESMQRLLKTRNGEAHVELDWSAMHELRQKHAMSKMQQKTTITDAAVGFATSGVLPIDRLPGITVEATQQLFLRDLLTATPTTMGVIDYVKVNNPLSIASPVPEASLKPENALTFVTASEKIRTIATFIPASRQVLEDFAELMNFIQEHMPYYVDLEEELLMISGDGTGENLHGLVPQASTFNTGLLIPKNGWNKIDVIGRAVQQILAAKELPPAWVLMHPNDWWDIRLTKDGFGRYILGDPQMGALAGTAFGSLTPVQNLFGLRVVATVNIAQGTFLVGSGNPIAVQIRDRMGMTIDVSTQHVDYFAKNLVAIRAEKRVALITRRAGSFITGTFTTSP